MARISPLEASTRYLAHLRQAWDQAYPDTPFEQQDVTITIPASFDPAARELTAEAARAAGYTSLTLLEEPQAALYNWIQGSGGRWRKPATQANLQAVVVGKVARQGNGRGGQEQPDRGLFGDANGHSGDGNKDQHPVQGKG